MQRVEVAVAFAYELQECTLMRAVGHFWRYDEHTKQYVAFTRLNIEDIINATQTADMTEMHRLVRKCH